MLGVILWARPTLLSFEARASLPFDDTLILGALAQTYPLFVVRHLRADFPATVSTPSGTKTSLEVWI